LNSIYLSTQDINSINLWIETIKDKDINVYSERERRENIYLARKLIQLKYNEIGYGWTRIVYDLNNGTVLKVALNNTGMECNKREYEIYSNCPDHIRKLLCPVKEYGYGWVIMERFDQKVPLVKEFEEKRIQLKKFFKDNGINPSTLHMGNLALTSNKELIVIDYGNFIV
jgi:hypothetical protein